MLLTTNFVYIKKITFSLNKKTIFSMLDIDIVLLDVVVIYHV